jgi:hypothetical protein
VICAVEFLVLKEKRGSPFVRGARGIWIRGGCLFAEGKDELVLLPPQITIEIYSSPFIKTNAFLLKEFALENVMIIA